MTPLCVLVGWQQFPHSRSLWSRWLLRMSGWIFLSDISRLLFCLRLKVALLSYGEALPADVMVEEGMVVFLPFLLREYHGIYYFVNIPTEFSQRIRVFVVVLQCDFGLVEQYKDIPIAAFMLCTSGT